MPDLLCASEADVAAKELAARAPELSFVFALVVCPLRPLALGTEVVEPVAGLACSELSSSKKKVELGKSRSSMGAAVGDKTDEDFGGEESERWVDLTLSASRSSMARL